MQTTMEVQGDGTAEQQVFYVVQLLPGTIPRERKSVSDIFAQYLYGKYKVLRCPPVPVVRLPEKVY